MFWSSAVRLSPKNTTLQPEEYHSHAKVERAGTLSFKNEQSHCFVAEASQLDMHCEHVLWWAWVISSHQFWSPQWINLLFQDKKGSMVSALSVVAAEVNDEKTGTVHEELPRYMLVLSSCHKKWARELSAKIEEETNQRVLELWIVTRDEIC